MKPQLYWFLYCFKKFKSHENKPKINLILSPFFPLKKAGCVEKAEMETLSYNAYQKFKTTHENNRILYHCIVLLL